MVKTLNPRRSLISNKVSFLIAGAAIAAWAPLIPFIKERFALDENQLGTLLLCVGVGSIMASPLAGFITARFGCRLPIYVASFLWGVCLIAISLLHNIYLLAATLILFGMVAITLEIVSNINGTLLEKLSGHSVMSGLHALYSVGSLTGSAGVTFVLGAQFGIEVAAIFAVGSLWALLLIGGRHLVSDAKMLADTDSADSTADAGATPDASAASAANADNADNTASAANTSAPAKKPRYITHPYVILIGVALFIMYLLEGGIMDWSGVFLYEVRNFPIEQGGYGFAAFAVTMTVFRMCGDRIVERCGRRLVIMGGTMLIFLSLTLTVLIPGQAVSLICFALIGLGSSNVIPQLVSFAAKIPNVPMHVAVTLVNAIGFTGMLAGPALIGFLAHWISLSYTFICLGVLVLVVTLISFRLMRPCKAQPSSPAQSEQATAPNAQS